MDQEIARRVADSIPPTTTHAHVAGQIGLSKEKLSKSLNGHRAFSSVELAQIAEVLGVDVHWLITGNPDPHRIVAAARHDFDHNTGTRSVPGRTNDQQVLDDIALAYRQAFAAWTPQKHPLPSRLPGIREALGHSFVRRFADRIESGLHIDVIRVAEVSTAYSFHVGPQPVIVIPATGNWFRENWSLAHELAHLAFNHHTDDLTPQQWDRLELAANQFAAELLLPASKMVTADWEHTTERDLAELVWNHGVSTDALARRLESLAITVPDRIRAALQLTTQRLLRWYWAGQEAHGTDQITERIDEAAARRFPLRLQEAHTELIAEGAVRKETLAWMLGIDSGALEFDDPAGPEPVRTDELAAALGL